MAPSISIAFFSADPVAGKRRPLAGAEELRRRNEELEKEVREATAREQATRAELEKTRERLRVVEEAEERLCAQLGDLEAEAVVQAREFRIQVKALAEELARARSMLGCGAGER
ncbi:protein RESPONSE TO LOW SULFUR 2-like [Typha latifolia]|uniref:protein RESPONSE TO LOW SULFUR 2-like n=1 Tax=Typha latifolia TaxID=4733 RepID=UPI003C30D64E